jgi:hypothetical protein
MVSAEELQKQIQNALLGATVFKDTCSDASHDPQANVRLTLATAVESTTDGPEIHVHGHLQVTLSGEPAGMERFLEDTEAVGIVPLENEAEKGQLLVTTTLRLSQDLLRSYLERQRLWGAEPKQLYAALKSDAGETRLEAIHIIGKRQLRDAVTTLLVLLEDDDERIRDAALGALLRMRETRAVTILTRSRAMRDSREMHKVIEAIASLGGPEALSYLAFVAENHDRESIRIAAQNALKRIKKTP